MGWTHQDLTLLTGAPKTRTAPCAYVFDVYGTEHVIHVGEDGHIYELWWSTDYGWLSFDLTTATGAPVYPISSVSFNPQLKPAGYVFGTQATQHVIYVHPDDGHIHELWWDGGWHHHDLTAIIGAPPAAAAPPCAYGFEAQRTQHIDYIGRDDAHVHELWWGNGGWNHNDLSAASGGPPASFVSPAAYVIASEQHVTYIGEDSDVHQLVWVDSRWSESNLTSFVGISPSGPTALAAYVFATAGTQYITFADETSVQELSFEGGAWQFTDVTEETGVGNDSLTLCAWPFEQQSTRHIAFAQSGGQVIELWRDGGGWHTNNLTGAAGVTGTAPADQGTLAAYAFTAQGTQHVFYLGIEDNHVHALEWRPRPWVLPVPPIGPIEA